MNLSFERCPNCNVKIKPSHSYCLDCSFSWTGYGKNKLAKKLKAWRKIDPPKDNTNLEPYAKS